MCPLSRLLDRQRTGHHFCDRLGRPFERMSYLVPLVDVEIDFVSQVFDGCKVWDFESFALEDAEPLLNLVHPRTVNGSEMKSEARMLAQPFHALFAFVDAQVVTHNMNHGDVIGDLAVEVLQEGDELLLPFPSKTSPVHSACAGIKSGEEIDSAFADVFMFDTHRFVGFCRFGRLLSGTGLQGCFLIETEHHLMGEQLPGVEVADFQHLSTERFISRCLGTQPHVMPPRFQVVSR